MVREPSSSALVAGLPARGAAKVVGPALAGVRLFVVHAPEDAWFVEGFLVPASGLSDDEVVISGEIEPGAPIVADIERAVLEPVTVVVVSPAFAASPWERIANRLADRVGLEAARHGSGAVIPAILADCDLPMLWRFRVPLDFRRREGGAWEVEAARLRERLAAPAPVAEAPVRCPYPGLRPFTADDAADLHGRDREVAELVRRLRERQRELVIVGPAGVGKSSLVAAGLIPRLAQSAELAGGPFAVAQMRPGGDPTGALVNALGATATQRSEAGRRWLGDAVSWLLGGRADHRLLIVIDQLEELFTLAEPDARAAFLAMLRLLRGDPRVVLLGILRAEHYASAMESALWTELDVPPSRLDVSLPRSAELRAAIEAPARAVGVHCEPALVERLLREVEVLPRALPLLQDTLQELWHYRTRGLICLAAYEAMTGGAGLAAAIVRRADIALGELPVERGDLARRVILRLVDLDAETCVPRRPQARTALAVAGVLQPEIDAVLHPLVERRLVTARQDAAGSERVALAHEVLLTAWPTLGAWIQTRRQDQQRHRMLEGRAAAWLAHGRGASHVLDAEELREARAWLATDEARELGAGDDVRRLLARSQTVLAAAAEADARHRRWRRWGGAALVALAGGVLAVSAVAVSATRSARDARDHARRLDDQLQQARRQARTDDEQASEVRRKAAAADEQSQTTRRLLARDYLARGRAQLTENQPARAVPYLLAAREAGVEDTALRMLFRWAARSVPVLAMAHRREITAVAWSPDARRDAQAVTPPLAHQAAVSLVAWSADGVRVATASADRTARIWDAASGQPATPPLAHGDAVTWVAWSADGTRVATASADRTARIWVAASGQPATPPLPHKGSVAMLAWSADGSRLATASADGTARIWDAATGQPVTPPLAHRAEIAAVAFSPDGRRLVTASADRTARIWDAVTGRPAPPLPHRAPVTRVAWSPDGRRLATASADGTARIWDAVTGQPIALLAHQGKVTAVAWSPDGRRLATASDDRTARIWDASGRAAASFAHPQPVAAIAWSPDGRRVITGGNDGTARVWTAGAQEAAPPLAHAAAVRAAAWSPDGTRLVTATSDGTVRVWDAATGQVTTPPQAPLGAMRTIRTVLWSPDGAWLATASTRGNAQVWDAISGQAVMLPVTHGAALHALAWSPDSKHLATASADATARIWDVGSGEPVGPPLAHQRDVDAVGWSPDGKRLATASADATARIWDAAGGQPATPPLPHDGPVRSVAFSPDGTHLVTTADRAARIWDAASGQPAAPPLVHPGVVTAAAWSHDGKRLATASADGTARIWDTATGQPITSPLSHPRSIEAIAWSPDATQLATASSDGTARIWDAATGQALTPPLVHQGDVHAIAWRPDGAQLVTASEDHTTRIWDISGDPGTVADWRAIAERGAYRLDPDGAVVGRDGAASRR
ncbi:MAG: hypothetical protein E6J90_18160 [Deltaproteobacteria bacterium]|nr:MAG: hypothetical protein E6J90_18160 [Deltaproteobacteria bacterium]